MKKKKDSELLRQLKASIKLEETKRKCCKELDSAFDKLGPIGLNDSIKCVCVVYVEENME